MIGRMEPAADTELIAQRLTEAGITPRDDRDGGSVAYAYGHDGEDLGPVWSEPSYPEDLTVLEDKHPKVAEDRARNSELVAAYDAATDTGPSRGREVGHLCHRRR